ncbi:MAG: hypothetical protein P8M30_15265 [Planctomycetaceae bacterium]|jgi:hypothetical protein|nr:hypothetical protein [Planctomycetaceae bacterium]
MARCDQGYLCEVCGEEVENITDSDLYMRFVLGEIDARHLMNAPERHLRCNPTQSQFIVDDKFPAVAVDGPFNKSQLDAEYVGQQEELITRAWRRLQEVRSLGIPISEYPLPEVIEQKTRKKGADA